MSSTSQPELQNLRIDRDKKRPREGSGWATKWIIAGVIIFALLGLGRFVYGRMNAPAEVEVVRVRAASASAGSEGPVILNATGYIIAAHKIQLASKVMGKVAWIGVEKGNRVDSGQVLVRLEDDEYRAQVMQARGNLNALEARLAELQNGSRPDAVVAA